MTLPSDTNTVLASFEQQLRALQAALDSPPLPSLAPLQTYFQQRLLPLAAALPGQTPLFTEANRQMRLLGIDAAFLQAARQAPVQQHRQTQMEQRLQDLLAFVQALRDRLET